MVNYIVDFAKNRKEVIPDILKIFYEYTHEEVEIILKYYFRNNSRVVLAYDEKELIGFYLYANAKTFFSNPSNLLYKLRTIDKLGIDVDKCTVAIYSLIKKNQDASLYNDLLTRRYKDAISQGYEYSIINMNANAVGSFCIMKEWSDRINELLILTGGSVLTTDTKNYNNDNIIIHKYT